MCSIGLVLISFLPIITFDHIFVKAVPITVPLAIILGIISIFKIKGNKEQLKGISLSIAGIVIAVAVAVVLGLGVLYRMRSNAHSVACIANISGLRKAILLYAGDNDGQYPTAHRWCDLLVKHVDVHGERFRCPGNRKERCSYAINPNAEPNSQNDIVLLFETKGGWNQFGGAEILTFENHEGKGCNVLYNGGDVEFVKPEEVGRLKWKPDKNKSESTE